MYNMEISIGSYKCRLEICILAFVLFWIMFGHVLCSCCTMSMQEGFDMMKSLGMGKKEAYAPRARRAANVYDANHTTSDETFVAGAPRVNRYDATHISDEEEAESMKMMGKEGFVSSNNRAYGPEFESSKAPGYIMKPDTWAMPTLSYSIGTTPSAGAEAILNRPRQPIPLPEGELDMFATTKFHPRCCPNAFSSSMGCACMTTGQLNYLHARGGNNVPYSEY
jgi:hypothetical protein